MADQLYYCVKCKDKREMKNPQEVTMKNGKPAKKGQCAECGTTMFAIIGARKASRPVLNFLRQAQDFRRVCEKRVCL
jgi:hypothetical protein